MDKNIQESETTSKYCQTKETEDDFNPNEQLIRQRPRVVFPEHWRNMKWNLKKEEMQEPNITP